MSTIKMNLPLNSLSHMRSSSSHCPPVTLGMLRVPPYLSGRHLGLMQSCNIFLSLPMNTIRERSFSFRKGLKSLNTISKINGWFMMYSPLMRSGIASCNKFVCFRILFSYLIIAVYLILQDVQVQAITITGMKLLNEHTMYIFYGISW